MNNLFIFFLIFLFSLSIQAKEKLVIYTYDSFISEWGPGPHIKQTFEERNDVEIEFFGSESAATLLSKLLLEGKSTKADIVLGLDMNLMQDAIDSQLFEKHSIKNIYKRLDIPIDWENDFFVPYNYGYFAFVYNNKKIKKTPKSMAELINDSNLTIVIQDPRTSTPGLGLLTWIKSLYKNDAQKNWKKLNNKVVAVTKGWTDSYYNIFLSGEADMVLSYTTSPAAHIMYEDNYDYSALIFDEGNYLSIEYSGILKNSQNKILANKFLEYTLSRDFQSVIPKTNIMYPVIKIENLPKAYEKIIKPKKTIQLNPSLIKDEKNKWINEWLNAL